MSGTTLKLICLVWPDDRPKEHIVLIEINDDDVVAQLKKMIKDRHARALAHVDDRDLILWKCSIPVNDNLQETLETIHFDQPDTRLHYLPPASSISEHFSTPLPGRTIHILAEAPMPGECSTRISYSTAEARKLLAENVASLFSLPNLSYLRDERQKFNATFSRKAPSSQGVPSEFSKLQLKQSQKIVWSRPPSADATVPVTLMHPIFRQFIDNCENHRPNRQDNELVLDLMTAMSPFYLDKGARAAPLHEILTEYGIPAVTSTIRSKGRDFRTNGSVEDNGYLLTIIDVKEEIGSKGAEPYAEVILYYTHSTLEKAKLFPNFNFPALLITVFGPQISFSGAVWTIRPHFQVLTPTLPLFCHHTDTNMRESLARHFGAYKTAVQSLEVCYEGLTNTTLLENLDSQFPDPRTYHSLDTETIVDFKYLHQIDEEKLLFVGETNNKERICIKFVRRYSREVHQKCAEMGIAPKLRGFEDIGAGWKMVIMDALDEYKPFDERTPPEGAEKYLKKKLVELHLANFVHGDVRDTNIMVRKDGKLGLMLVDFDWSGIVGEVRYPINVNKTNIWRPDDVSDGQLINPDHDMAMLRIPVNAQALQKLYVHLTQEPVVSWRVP